MQAAEVVQWQIPNITISRIGPTNGGEYASACPYCGGRDRFRIWPNQGETGRFWCRQCNEHGDLIDHLRRQKGMSFQEACQVVGKTPTKKRRLNVDVSWRKEKPAFENIESENKLLPEKNVEPTPKPTPKSVSEVKEQPISDFYYDNPKCETCSSNVKGWCLDHPRNHFVNIHFIDRCPEERME